ncbi:hypothetical protein HZY97_18195 [Sphingomonas sp. R-74633]|uniref:hypothetical protein n=1 Tax=Sphingomonas sp. R-74633 TaxID=2751188 RepID=UPI0015D3A4BC|nr:hypothetical protein [Sphingomonas sp. R-74633]NYT42711.1 hypothetical protein [Sphingomonas sp. R-74633]
MTIKKLLALAALLFAPAAHASPPLPAATIDVIAKTLPSCTGGWQSAAHDWKMIGPAELAPRLALLNRPSLALDEDGGYELYEIGKAMLFPALGAPTWFVDGGPGIKCPARPKEAIALLEYLVGEHPGDLRGWGNAFDVLGLAYAIGAVGAPDPVRAQHYYLRGRIHWQLLGHDSWSDGKDKDLLANIERAGMRPYLEEQALRPYSGAAHIILAEEALPSDPARARKLLLIPDFRALNRLFELEAAGSIPEADKPADIPIWVEAIRMTGNDKLIARMFKAVNALNGGTLPTATERPAVKTLLALLRRDTLRSPGSTPPIPLRALVDPQGRLLYVQLCTSAGARFSLVSSGKGNARRLFDPARLPPLPVPTIDGRPAYGWVILPAVQFKSLDNDKVSINLIELPAESCAVPD